MARDRKTGRFVRPSRFRRWLPWLVIAGLFVLSAGLLIAVDVVTAHH